MKRSNFLKSLLAIPAAFKLVKTAAAAPAAEAIATQPLEMPIYKGISEEYQRTVRRRLVGDMPIRKDLILGSYGTDDSTSLYDPQAFNRLLFHPTPAEEHRPTPEEFRNLFEYDPKKYQK